MHRSRLTSVVIDCAEADFEKGAEFWSAALGRPLVSRNERFSSLRGRTGGGVHPIKVTFASIIPAMSTYRLMPRRFRERDV